MTGNKYAVTVQHLGDSLRVFTITRSNACDAVATAIRWMGSTIAGYTVTITDPNGGTACYDGAAYLLDGGIEIGTPCAGCGGPCDATDAVADDSGQAWCGSMYGNGCAERVTA